MSAMKYKITRRDFLNGVAIGTGATLLTPAELFALDATGLPSDYYPPTLSGLRGNHPGSYEVSHALAWSGVKPAEHRSLNEHYDLVVVGAGVSGLAAARFYQKRMGTDAKILLLDNHDDFGGHAKRNEFHHDGHMLLGIGGSVNLEGLDSYSAIASGLFDDLGIDREALAANMVSNEIMNGTSDSMIAFPGAGGHTKVRAKWIQLMLGVGDYESAIRELPLPAPEQDKLIELFSGDVDYLKDLSLSEKSAYIESTTYADFLTGRVGLAKETISMFYSFANLLYGAATPRLSVLEAFYLGSPGMQGMGWLGDMAAQLFEGLMAGYQPLYLPDGNATVARLLVHKLIPAVAPDTKGFEDIATSLFNYGALDQKNHPVRLRLNSTVVNVQESSNDSVTVSYVQNGDAVSVTGDHCVLACYNGAIPHICPQIPESQKEALRYGVKVPLVWANVLIRNGRAYDKLGVGMVSCPNDPYSVVTVPPPTTTGGYQPPQGPDDPMVIFMMGVPVVEPAEGETSRDLLLRARHKVYGTSFDTYEQEVRDQLQGLLGEYDFRHETDIQAITINRWAHGYAYEYMGVDDPEWEEGQMPHELGRAQFGRISIANSDSEGRAYLDAAIDAGWRAVAEQTT